VPGSALQILPHIVSALRRKNRDRVHIITPFSGFIASQYPPLSFHPEILRRRLPSGGCISRRYSRVSPAHCYSPYSPDPGYSTWQPSRYAGIAGIIMVHRSRDFAAPGFRYRQNYSGKDPGRKDGRYLLSKNKRNDPGLRVCGLPFCKISGKDPCRRMSLTSSGKNVRKRSIWKYAAYRFLKISGKNRAE
jgi:hypothetical protein